MLAAALEAEVDDYVAAFADERDKDGKRLVVRNGHAEGRSITTGAGPVEVHQPRVNDRREDDTTGERCRFRSSIIPPWARKSPKVAEVLPLMYLHGMSSGDFAPALEEFFGSAAGLSASVITRLTAQWQEEAKRFSARSLAEVDYVYVWADGVHFNVRLDESRLCALVMVGVRADGTKELVAIADGQRESTDSWADLLRDLRRRGMRAPLIAVGDGALGFWAALRQVFPDTVGSQMLGAQSRQRAQRPTQIRSARGPAGVGGDPRRRGPRPRPGRHQGLRAGLPGQVAQGGGQDRR
jgi:putative transposase